MNAAISQILETHFNLTATSISKLEGYDSINFKIASQQGTYVLKQYKTCNSIKEIIAAEHEVFEELAKIKNQEFPLTIPTSTNELFWNDTKNTYMLLRYVEGTFLGDVKHTSNLLYSFGTFLAKLDQQLQNKHYSPISAKQSQWDLQYFKQNYKYLDYISDPKDYRLVDYFFLQFDQHIYPIKDCLRKSTIHNDGNDWNVLTKEGKVSGLIDFGDMCHTWLINELAVALSYSMMGKEFPLEVAAHVIQGYTAILPLKEEELDILYYLIAGRLCTSVCNSAYAKTLKPDSEYITISEQPAWDLLRKWVAINPEKARSHFHEAAGKAKPSAKSITSQLERRNKVIPSALGLSYTSPIEMQGAAFQYMYDTEGNTFLDAYNNIMLAGHSHPSVVRAGQQAMAKLNTNTRYIYDALLSYGEKLLEKFPPHLNKVFLVNSGSAASDLAIRIAKTHTKKENVLVVEHGYHGNSQVGIELSHYKYNHKNGPGKQSYILETPMPKAFNSGYDDNGAAGTYFAKKTNATITANEANIAAFIAEPILGCGGQVPLAKEYLKKCYPKIRAQGGICISDEVQVGFGRLGKYFWGYEMHGVVPDMVILGKPMGNGHPIGAVVTTSEIAKSFSNGLEFFSSFGGNPVSCAIGAAVLEVIENEKLQEHAKKTGNYLIKLLKNLQEKHPQLADVRGSGLFIGVELVQADKPGTTLASHIKNELRNNHILISTDGPYDNVLKIKPPLSFTINDCDILCQAIDTSIRNFNKK